MKKLISALLSVAAILFIASCGSKPKPEPLPETPVVEEVVEEQKEEVKEEPDFYAQNMELLALTEAAREKAIAAEAKKYYSDGFDSAESKYTTVKSDVEANKKVDYSAVIKDLTSRYESLAAASQAQVLKAKADQLELAGEDKESYEAGEKALSEYASLGPDGKGVELLIAATTAYEAYSNVVWKGLKASAGRQRQAALEAKKNADSVRAGVARKEDYTKASDTFKKADSSFVTGNIEGAYNGYKKATVDFTELYNSIFAKRAAAQALIDAAKQKVIDAANYAEEADSIAPLEEGTAGIENEDAVLLEEDTLANPDDAVINIEEGATAEEAGKAAETAIAEEAAENAKKAPVEAAAETQPETPAETTSEATVEAAPQEAE